MKTQLFIISAIMAGLGLSSCDRNGESDKGDTYLEESIEAQNEMSGPLHEDDTNMVQRDGTLLDGTFDQMENVALPAQVVKAIEDNTNYSKKKIISKRKFTEDNKVYYEVKFSINDKESETVIYDENGDIKSENS